MPKDIIPKPEKTAEVINENLLKYTFLCKRLAKRKNVVPRKFVNRHKYTINILEKERTHLVKSLNTRLSYSTQKQDENNTQTITKLHNLRIHKVRKLRNIRKLQYDLDREIDYWISTNKGNGKTELKNSRSRTIYRDVVEILLEKQRTYNDRMKKQQDLMDSLDDVLRQISIKCDLFNKIMYRLKESDTVLSDLSRNAKEALNERDIAYNKFKNTRKAHIAEIKKMNEKMFLTLHKLRMDLSYNVFLVRKRAARHNRYAKKMTENKNIEIKNTQNEELVKFIKYLIYIGGDTDLSTVVNNVGNVKNYKESLFRLCIFFEHLFAEMNNSINATKRVASKRVNSINYRNEVNDCKLKSYMETIKDNEREISSNHDLANDLQGLYVMLNEQIYNICQALHITPSSIGLSEPPNEMNFLSYAQEVEKRSDWIMFKLNCIERSCLTGKTDDPLTSDAESSQNLIAKDNDGIEIKMHRVLNMEDSTTIPTPDVKLETKYIQSPCPYCIEMRFRYTGYCGLLKLSEMMAVKDGFKSKPLCCPTMIKDRNFEKIHPELIAVMHNKNNCNAIKPKKSS